jgi:hypothetical protein
VTLTLQEVLRTLALSPKGDSTDRPPAPGLPATPRLPDIAVSFNVMGPYAARALTVAAMR